LHVLGTPPAFNLSQDQTLHLKILKINNRRMIQKGSNYFNRWTFWSLGLHAQSIDASPHTNYLPNF
jgi:hypothetical protein